MKIKMSDESIVKIRQNKKLIKDNLDKARLAPGTTSEFHNLCAYRTMSISEKLYNIITESLKEVEE